MDDPLKWRGEESNLRSLPRGSLIYSQVPWPLGDRASCHQQDSNLHPVAPQATASTSWAMMATEGDGIEPPQHFHAGPGLANRPLTTRATFHAPRGIRTRTYPLLRRMPLPLGYRRVCHGRDSNSQPSGSGPDASANWATMAHAPHRSRTCTERVLNPLPLPLGYGRKAMSRILRKGRGSNSQGSYARRFSGPLPSPAIGLPFLIANTSD